jgi:hypothetical protein
VHAGSNARIAGHDDDDGVRLDRHALTQQIHPGITVQIQVEQQDVMLATIDDLGCFRIATANRDGVTVQPQYTRAAVAQCRFIIDDEYAQARGDIGVIRPVSRKIPGALLSGVVSNNHLRQSFESLELAFSVVSMPTT